VAHVYAPYDLPIAVTRFLGRVRPQLAIVMETELWPNLYHACRKSMIPLLLVNARLSARSLAPATVKRITGWRWWTNG
jgi:3-deoxy-D-manno-octulosonic-acid transferase